MQTTNLSNQMIVTLNVTQLKDLIEEAVQKAIQEAQPKSIPTRYYTRKEACEILRITLPTLHNMINAGKLEALKVNGRTLLDANRLDEAVDKKTVLKYGRA